MPLALLALLLSPLDLTTATVVTPPHLTRQEQTATRVLIEEVEKRSGIHWTLATSAPPGQPAIHLATTTAPFDGLAAPRGPEGYRIVTQGAAVHLLGNDARGLLYSTGRLLRTLDIRPGSIRLPEPLRLATAPRYPIRGHQLGNRTLNNTVDAWTVPQWEQYFRDLAIFGTNAIELLPPRANENKDSPHSRLPLLDMMAHCSRLLDDYGLDVWIWYPALEKDYSNPATVQKELAEWTKVYARLPRIDAIFVPGGDPGHTHPKYLLPFLEKQAQALRKYHPRAQMWISPQGWDKEWLNEFVAQLNTGLPWLNGVVHGPGVRVSIQELRALVPARYHLRTYPDITHTVRSSYPVPDWDPAWAFTLGREPINPRPLAQQAIFQATREGSEGFVSYSDGTNDDVNKMIWSALGWDPDASLTAILQDYGRYFIGSAQAFDFAQGLLALEENWKGPLLANAGVDATFARFRTMERHAPPQLIANWRFQQALFRAYYDAYVRGRLIAETAQEARAMALLDTVTRGNAIPTMNAAEKVLDEATTNPPLQAVRARVFELGAALFQSIGMQLGTPLYGGYGHGRAASLDTIDAPLNDRVFLKSEFARIRAIGGEDDRLAALDALVNRTNPGPGGFYDDLGNPGRQPHFVQAPGVDPPWISPREDGPLAWASYAMSDRRAPVRMRYTGLDPAAQYRLRVVYAGGLVSQQQGMRCMANGKYLVHDWLIKPQPIRPVEFDVPRQATATGELTLEFDRQPTPSGRSRGAEVAEVWLLKAR